jgi:hypothetical protein
MPGTACGGLAPKLTITYSAPSVQVAWPSTFTGYTLQSTLNLAPSSWGTVLQPPVVVGGMFTVTNEAAGGAMFYRLKQ